MGNQAITAANIAFSALARFADGIAGAAMTQGQVVYLDRTITPEKYKLADADLSQAAANAAGIVASAAAADGQPVKVCWYDPSLAPGFAALSGTTYALSATAGAIALDADLANPSRKTIIGVGKAGGLMVFNPQALVSPDVIPA